jgi:hypothetical protein
MFATSKQHAQWKKESNNQRRRKEGDVNKKNEIKNESERKKNE